MDYAMFAPMRLTCVTLVLLSAVLGTAVRAAHTEASLILPLSVKPGASALVGVDLKMEPGWHTYWKNPGDAGQATEIKWNLPPGVTAGEIQWPLPKKIPPAEVTTYGYENEVMLLVPLTLASNLPPGALALKAKVSWLECKESCIPAGAEIQGSLNVGPANGGEIDFFNEKLLAAWQAKAPISAGNFPAKAWWEKPVDGSTQPLVLSWPGKPVGADFFPEATENLEIQGPTETLPSPAGEIRLRKQVKKFSGGWPKEISGVFVTADGANEAKAVIGDAPAPAAAGATVLPPQNTKPLWQMLLYAFIGGLILNIMPCVLPVIALKILGFVSEAKSSAARVRALGGIYAIGVLFYIIVIAALVNGV